MKKIYQTPRVSVTAIRTRQMITITSFDKNATGADANVVLSREDNAWDIWGSDDEEID